MKAGMHITLANPRCVGCPGAATCYFVHHEHDHRDDPKLRRIRWNTATATPASINPHDQEKHTYDFR